MYIVCKYMRLQNNLAREDNQHNMIFFGAMGNNAGSKEGLMDGGGGREKIAL